MKEYASVIVQGIIGVISSIIVWRLGVSANEKQRRALLDKERRDEIKMLYVKSFALIEKAIRQVHNSQELTLAEEFSDTNAQLRLLGTEQVVSQYERVASLLETWSALYLRSLPMQFKRGEDVHTLIQSPDPVAKYKKPAEDAHDELQRETHKLLELMRRELADHHGLSKARIAAGNSQDFKGPQMREERREGDTKRGGRERPALDRPTSRTDAAPRLPPSV